MNVLHILALGGAGGIESLSVSLAQNSKDNNFFYFLWGGGRNAERIREITTNVEIRNCKKSNILYEYKKFEEYCLANRIQCIVVQGVSPLMLLFASFFKIRHSSIKEVLYVHSDAKYCIPNIKVRWPFLFSFHLCDGCIAISKFVKESLTDLVGKSRSKKIHVIYNGVDVDLFSSKMQKDHFDKFHIIYVGRLIEGKGVQNLLYALSLTKINYELTIVGDGSYKCKLEEECVELNLTNKVSFVGTQWNIPEWLKKADVFVHPCNLKEGFGITLIEAMAMGVPCIAYNKGAMPEIIDTNINGFLVDGRNINNLVDAIENAYNMWKLNPVQWRELCIAAKKKAATFSITNYVNEVSTYLSSL